MRKQHHFHFLVLTLAAMCLVCILGPAAFASIVEETYIPLPEPSLEGLGYVAISADPPVGFEGILCVDFQRQGSSQTDTIQVSGLDYYAGGAWLKEGTYLVKDTYVLGSDHFSVTPSAGEIAVSQEQDASLFLTIIVDEEQEAHREQLAETFVPDSVPTFAIETAAAETTAPDRNPAIVDNGMISKIVPAVLFFLAAALVLGQYLYRRFFDSF